MTHAIGRAVEALEHRWLMSTSSAINLISPSASNSLTAASNALQTALLQQDVTTHSSSPALAADPVDPLKLAAAWVIRASNLNPQQQLLIGATSLDGGASWELGSYDLTVLDDPTVNPATSTVTGYTYISDVSVQFDRAGNFYVQSLQRNNDGTSGAIVLESFTFASTAASAPVARDLDPADVDQDGITTANVVYRWAGQSGPGGVTDAAVSPTLTVSHNLGSFTARDAAGNPVTVTDPSVLTVGGNSFNPIYVSWASVGRGSNPTGTINPNEIVMTGSSDHGLSFSPPRVVSTTPGGAYRSTTARYTAPKMVVSQGRIDRAGGADQVTPGVVNVIWTNVGVSAFTNNSTDTILSRRVSGPVQSARFVGTPGPVPIPQATPAASPVPFTVGSSGMTVDVPVGSLAAAGVTDVTRLSVGLSVYGPLQNLRLTLQSPGGPSLILVEAQAQDTGTVSTRGIASGNSLGTVAHTVGTTTTVINSPATIADGASARAGAAGNSGVLVGQYRAEAGSLNNFVTTLVTGGGLAALEGTWTLVVENYNTSASSTGAAFYTDAFSLQFGSGLEFDAGQTANETVTTTTVRHGRSATTYVGAAAGAFPTSNTAGVAFAPSPDRGVGASVVAAADNTLGDSARRVVNGVPVNTSGRIYVAFTDRIVLDGTRNSDPTVASLTNDSDNTDIFLAFSDDGGLTWNRSASKINNDDASVDGFSGASDKIAINTLGLKQRTVTGRAQFMPAISVDQQTGNVALSWYDARHDASRTRVTTYVGISTDGGTTFDQGYVSPNGVTNAITGDVIAQGPTPENFGALNATRDAFAAGSNSPGFGTQMGLVTAGGRAYPVWVGNDNGGSLPGTLNQLGIRSAVVGSGTGPKVISATSGAITSTLSVTTSEDAGGGVDTIAPRTANNTFGTDGRRLLDGFVVTFDRYVQASTMTTGSVLVWFRATSTDGSPVTPVSVPVTSIEPLFNDRQTRLDGVATQYLVKFAAQSGVGTYSYTVLPDAADTVRYFGFSDHLTTTVSLGAPAAVPAAAQTDVSLDFSALSATRLFLGARMLVSLTTTTTLADLKLSLVSPAGTVVVLADAATLTGTTITDAQFDEVLGDPNGIEGGASPYTGTYLSFDLIEGNNAGLDEFFREGVNGNWSLRIENTGTGDVTLSEFRLALATAELSGATTPVNGQALDQNADGRGGVLPQFDLADDTTPVRGDADLFARPASLSPFSVRPDFSFGPAYDSSTLPLIVPGLHVESTTVIAGSGGTLNGVQVANGTVSQVEVRFDRDVDIATFTGADVLSIVGPRGDVLGPQRFTSTDATPTRPLAIPEAPSLLRAESRIVVTDSFDLSNVRVQLSVSHASLSDLAIELVAPNGTVVQLVAEGDITGTDLANTLFDQNSTVDIVDTVNATAPYQRPTGFRPVGDLSTLAGLDSAGVWKLRVRDGVNGTTGVLNYWSLLLTPAASNVTVTQPDSANLRRFLVTFPEQRLSGTYTLTLGSDIAATDGTLLDSSLDAGLEQLRQTGGAGAPTLSTRYVSANIPVFVGAGQTQDSTLTLSAAEQFLVTNVVLQLNISHPNVPDLKAELIAPDGTSIVLFDGVGQTAFGSRANFQNTIFTDDTSTPTSPINNGAAPFLGAYTPQDSLSTLEGGTVQASGTWRLRVTNSGTQQATINGWNLTLGRSVAGSNLGEAAADQTAVTFQIHQFQATNGQSSSEVTGFGPNPTTTINPNAANSTRAGRVNSITVDESDPTGNTVYAAGASGGVWKTRNFLTTDANGPTWVPLTDFGPTASLNVGSIALFPRNNNPDETVVIVGTGDPNSVTEPGNNLNFTFRGGVGFLRSDDGGRTWIVLNSTDNNFDSNGNLVPLADRTNTVFDGAVVYRVQVDPRATVSGEVIIWAALGGSDQQNGIWRSVDSGRNWTRVLDTSDDFATDVLLDQNSGYFDTLSNPTGNLQYVYAAVSGQGVYRSANFGNRWDLLVGGLGKPTLVDPDRTNPVSGQTPVDAPAGTPNGTTKYRITLAKPALTGNDAQDIQYQGWVYALVSAIGTSGQNPPTSDFVPGTFEGLYVTKDTGANWTKVQLKGGKPFANFARGNKDIITPDPDGAVDLDPGTRYYEQAMNDTLSLAVDPADPAVVYVGGYKLYRIDTTFLYDPHAFFVANGSNVNAGVGLSPGGPGPAVLTIASATAVAGKIDPVNNPYINLLQDPNDPYNTNSSIRVGNIAKFINSGEGATWREFGQDVLNNGLTGMETITSGDGATGHHQIIARRDPRTGQTRLIMATDHGIYTGEYAADGTPFAPTQAQQQPILGSRNGNIQVAQLHYGAVDPRLAADVAIANRPYFVVGGKDLGAVATAPGVNVIDGGLVPGATNWIGSNATDASGVAIDQTGTGANYVFYSPGAGESGSIATDFFRVGTGPTLLQGVSRVTGLFNVSGSGTVLSGDPQWPDRVILNFAVNPINGNEAVIASATGRVYATSNQGRSWSQIATPAQIGIGSGAGQAIPAIAFGAPDPTGSGGTVGSTSSLIYVGTAVGTISVTFTGGGGAGNAWIDLSAGLNDDSPIRSIITSPGRGTHEAYAVTDTAVYYMADSSAPGATWVDITGGLFEVTGDAFGDPNMKFSRAGISARTIAADWRYRIPGSDGEVHPAIYVGTDGGVFRSLDNGDTWTAFPDVGVDSSSIAGGGLPNAQVNDLDLSLGPINPVTGYPDSSRGENLLMVTTYGRGVFAVRVAPVVVQATTADGNQPDAVLRPNEYVSGNATPTFTGRSQATAFGNVVRITLLDLTDPLNPIVIGGYDPSDTSGPGGSNATDTAANRTDDQGAFSVDVNSGVFTTDGRYTIGIRAEDAQGVRGTPVQITYTLDTVAPVAPTIDVLPTGQDSGASNSDGVTNTNQPTLSGTAEADSTVTLFVDGVAVGTTVASDTGAWNFSFATNNVTLADGSRSITATATDFAGNVSVPSAALVLTVDTAAPSTPPAPTLVAADDSGSSNSDAITNDNTPRITGTAEANATITVFRNGVLVPSATTTADGTGAYTTQLPALADGTYQITVVATDLAGNPSAQSPVLTLEIRTSAPTAPVAPVITSTSDTGVSSSDGVTQTRNPFYNGTATANAVVQLLVSGPGVNLTIPGTANGTGTYLLQVSQNLPDGTYSVRVTQTDVAGNISAPSAAATLVVDNAAPVVTGLGVSGTKGQPFSGPVATYTDANVGGPSTITWGDSNSSAGTDAATTPPPTRRISGSNTFARVGTFNYTVAVTDLAGNVGNGNGVATITGAPVSATGGVTISATEAVATPSVVVATFTDPLGAEPVGNYAASILWGDGSAAEAGTITYSASTGVFSVAGSHRYGENGTYSISVTITGGGINPVTVTSSAVVANQPVTLTAVPFNATAGVAFTGVVATFLDAGDAPVTSNFTATIEWGDGTTTAGTINQDTNNPKLFSVSGTITYIEGARTFSPVVRVRNEGALEQSITTTATVANAVPTVTIEGQSTVFAGSAASFIFRADDVSPSDDTAGFTYTVNYGDGSPNVVVDPSASNGAGVTLLKTYQSTGTFTISVIATDRNGGQATATRQVTVALAPTISNPTIDGSPFDISRPLSSVGTVTFTVSSATPGVTLPNLTTGNLTLVRNAFDVVPLTNSTFTFDPTTGLATLNLLPLDLADGDYELRVSVPNAPTRTIAFNRLEGDLNGDGIVNGKDTSLLRKARGKTTGQTGFIAAGDFNGNGQNDRNDEAVLRTLVGHRLVTKVRTITFNPRKPLQRIPALSFAGRVGSAITAQDIVLRNGDTTRAVSLSDINFSGATGTFQFVVVGQSIGSTSASIAPGGSVRLRVYFRPTAVGTQRASATFGISFVGTQPQIVVIEAQSRVRE